MTMRRREFLAGLGGAAVWPVVARAQQQTLMVGFLNNVTTSGPMIAAFRGGLGEMGFYLC
jgi:hypothetical protein